MKSIRGGTAKGGEEEAQEKTQKQETAWGGKMGLGGGRGDRQTERLKWLSKHIVLKNGDT